jgi:hypothetical protein
MKRSARFLAVCLMIGLACFFATGTAAASSGNEDKMYREFDGIVIFYTPKDVASYRALLPEVFDLPDQPLVQAFVIDYYKMAPWAIKPYQEAAIFLLAKYRGKEIWHCIIMPVTSDEARIPGIKYLGYPKVLAEVAFNRKPPVFAGTLKAAGKTILTVLLDTRNHPVTDAERQWFRRLAGIPPVNFLKGRLVKPRPAGSKETTLLEWSEKYPEFFQVATGAGSWSAHPQNAPRDRDWRPGAFDIGVQEIVLAYYFCNKYGFSFGKPEEAGQ